MLWSFAARGIGIIHYNIPIEEQVSHIQTVKRHVPGFVDNPVVKGPKDTVAEIDELKVWLVFTGQKPESLYKLALTRVPLLFNVNRFSLNLSVL